VRVHHQRLKLQTQGKSFHDITSEVATVVAETGIENGLCNVFVQHTSASLVIQENADPAVLRDLARWFADLAPESRAWEHDDEGPDDMPAHARSALTRSSESIPVQGGRLSMGTWQALYLWEHRARAHQRQLLVTVLGE